MVVVGKPEWVADWYRHERALTFRLADQVSALTTLLNHTPAPPGHVIRDAASREVAGQPPPTCRWVYCDIDYHWQGSCGVTWWFPDENPPERHEMNFCPKCGQILEVTPAPQEPTDE